MAIKSSRLAKKLYKDNMLFDFGKYIIVSTEVYNPHMILCSSKDLKRACMMLTDPKYHGYTVTMDIYIREGSIYIFANGVFTGVL